MVCQASREKVSVVDMAPRCLDPDKIAPPRRVDPNIREEEDVQPISIPMPIVAASVPVQPTPKRHFLETSPMPSRPYEKNRTGGTRRP